MRGQLGSSATANLGDGPGEMGSALSPVDAGGLVVDVALGYQHSCALRGDGSVVCWGYNVVGQLGVGDTTSRGDNAGEMGASLVAVPLGATATRLALGTYHACALLSTGGVKCWGYNSVGQLGQGNMNNVGDAAGEVAGLAPINLGSAAIDIGAGDGHACALLQAGTVKCWGGNGQGQLGQGDTAARGGAANDMANLAAIALGGQVVQLVVGGFHACALLATGAVKCWGNNVLGQLGLGDTNARGDAAGEMGTALPAVPLAGTVTQLALGVRHSCALLAGGTVECWGSNTRGSLGQGDTVNRGDNAGEVAALAPIALAEPAVAIAAGGEFSVDGGQTCAVLQSGAVECWGDNNAGQLGVGDTTNRGIVAGDMAALGPISLGW